MSKNQLPRKQPNTFIRFSNLTIQMGVIIGISAWGGVKLDAYFKTEQPYYTIVLSLLGIGVALYIVLKGVISDSKKDDEK